MLAAERVSALRVAASARLPARAVATKISSCRSVMSIVQSD